MNATIKDNNFIAIQGWMRNKLGLKGHELIVYALIYGFSQDGSSSFSGTRRYIAEWCGCSMRTVDNTLASLLGKKLIVKHEKYVNMIRVCDYTAVPPEAVTRENDTQATSPTTAEHHDTECHTAEAQPLLNEPQTPTQPKAPDPTEDIVAHLNQRAGTHYRATTANTRKLIKARLKEGFTVDEFKLVIDKKCADWLNNRDMVQYLRPETLFGNKFESYLNAKPRTQAIRTNPGQQAAYIDRNKAWEDGHVAECTRENGWF